METAFAVFTNTVFQTPKKKNLKIQTEPQILLILVCMFSRDFFIWQLSFFNISQFEAKRHT